MYVEITVSLKPFDQPELDIRLSDYHTVKKVIEIVGQATDSLDKPNPTSWIRVLNKDKVITSDIRLVDAGITTGDCIEIIPNQNESMKQNHLVMGLNGDQ